MKDERRAIILSRLRQVCSILEKSKGKLTKRDREVIHRFVMTLPTHMFRFVVQYVHHLDKHRKGKK